MQNRGYLLLALAIGAGCFLIGRWSGGGAPAAVGASTTRRILYYHDPMHPGYKSGKPGIAPDCGMALEPVYEGEAPPASVPAGAIHVTPEKQQLIGVRVGTAEARQVNEIVRSPGRVSFDETQVYRLTTATDGWIRSILPVTAGAMVQEGELLATFYSREFLTSQQSYFYALNTRDRFQKLGTENADQVELTNAQIRSSEENLQAQGMTEAQIRAIAKTRKPSRDIEIRAPAAGLVVVRNVFPGLRFDRGAELYRIADLRKVWILVDLFESQAGMARPGDTARVRYQGRVFQARVSAALPQFDATSRTLKLRLEMDNPGLTFRPDMFVDVEWPVRLPAGVSVPADVVIDSGVRKVVYVDRGEGYFEPREVTVAWQMGGRAGIERGLKAGERIVVGGNFLLDSESRMHAPAAKDPVCGMEVAPGSAAASVHEGKTYHFCSAHCKSKFDAEPVRYAGLLQRAVKE